MIDTTNWLTKAEAARQLQTSEKHIERLVKRGRLQQGARKTPGKRPMAIYNPKDVERELEQQNSTLTVTPFVESGPVAPAIRKQALTALPGLVPGNGALAVPLQEKLFLTIKEAVAYSGLPLGYLETLIETGKLKAVEVGHSGNGVRRRIRKRDLEKL